MSLTPLANPREFVLYWLDHNKIAVSPTGKLSDGKGRGKHQLFPSLWLDYVHLLRLKRAEVADENANLKRGEEKVNAPTGIPEKDMRYAYDEAIEIVMVNKRESAILAVEYSPAASALGGTELERWVMAVTGKLATTAELAVMRHWLWQVKRKMAMQPVVYHLMPVIVSPIHGSGKSTAVRKLCAPLADYVIDADATLISDERRHFAFSNYFVALFDEMAGVERTDVETLKRLITTEQLSVRPMKTNDVVQIDQRCTFIGTANKSVSLLINDTGMRRFFEFTAQDKIDWGAINEIDYAAVWQAIDETRVRGYIEDYMVAVKEAQEELATEDPVRMFLEECGFVPLPADFAGSFIRTIRGAKLYEAYAAWSDDNGYKRMQSGTLGKRLKQIGIRTHRGSQGVRYLLSDTSTAKDTLVEEAYGKLIQLG